MMCLSLVLMNCTPVVLGNNCLNIPLGIKLPLLPVSILYAILHLFHLILVSSFVTITDLTPLNLNDLIVMESMFLLTLICMFDIPCYYLCLTLSHLLPCLCCLHWFTC